MFLPPPVNYQDEHKVSEKVLPPAVPTQAPHPSSRFDEVPEHEVPQGDDLFYHVLHCLDKGSSPAEVRKQLIAFGHSSDEAENIVEVVQSWRQKNPGLLTHIPAQGTSENGTRNMLIGGGICLLGLVITIGSLMAATEGGRYTIAYGAIIWGGIQFFRGLMQSGSSRE